MNLTSLMKIGRYDTRNKMNGVSVLHSKLANGLYMVAFACDLKFFKIGERRLACSALASGLV